MVLRLECGEHGAYIGVGVFNAFALEPVELFYRGDVEQLLAVFDESRVDAHFGNTFHLSNGLLDGRYQRSDLTFVVTQVVEGRVSTTTGRQHLGHVVHDGITGDNGTGKVLHDGLTGRLQHLFLFSSQLLTRSQRELFDDFIRRIDGLFEIGNSLFQTVSLLFSRLLGRTEEAHHPVDEPANQLTDGTIRFHAHVFYVGDDRLQAVVLELDDFRISQIVHALGNGLDHADVFEGTVIFRQVTHQGITQIDKLECFIGVERKLDFIQNLFGFRDCHIHGLTPLNRRLIIRFVNDDTPFRRSLV